jgi:hypothetical protein
MNSKSAINIILCTLLIFGVPSSSADSSIIVPRPDDCTNDGVILQASVGQSTFNCSGECTNNGVVVQAGSSSAYTCDGGCSNNGVMVWGLKSDNACATRSPLPGACVGAICTTETPCFQVQSGCEITPLPMVLEPDRYGHRQSEFLAPCELSFYQKGFSTPDLTKPVITCGQGENCGVAQDPGCWSVRLVCNYAKHNVKLWDYVEERDIHCQSWS